MTAMTLDEVASGELSPAADWYFRNYPKAPRHNPRLLTVLSCWEALYNLPIVGRGREDGGIRACGEGIMVRCRPGVSMSTYDDSALTRLVAAAHAYCCRVGIQHNRSAMEVTVFPRDPDGTKFYNHHPTVVDLTRMAEEYSRKVNNG